MELSFSELREKEVINTGDGKSLGRVSDIVFSYPNGEIYGIVVPGRKGWHLFRCRCNDMFIDLCHVKKIGNDVVLVDLRFGDRPNLNDCRNDCRHIPDRNDCGRIPSRDDCDGDRPHKQNDRPPQQNRNDNPRSPRIDVNDYE